ncbi:MAG: MqnA/MqnD/SBP family protein, partial [Phycisphaeraceae bacterium]
MAAAQARPLPRTPTAPRHSRPRRRAARLNPDSRFFHHERLPHARPDAATLRIGHSPDPDDAFMWYPLADFIGPDGRQHSPKIDTAGYRFVHVLEDIQALNERSEQAELEITALSIHQYPYIADKYALTSCGASMGDGYGPMLVAPQKIDLRELVTPLANTATPAPGQRRRPRIAIPGQRTSAWLALQLLLLEHGIRAGDDHGIDYEVVMFDQIIPAVVNGEFDAGLIIHEGQLTYAGAGLACVVDLGAWWKETRGGLPLPLGGNAVRRDLGEQMPRITRVLLESIRWALDHRRESVDFALNYARDMGHDLAD